MVSKQIMRTLMKWFAQLQTNLEKVLESLLIYKGQKLGWVALQLAP
jgi:hypothetical protein